MGSMSLVGWFSRLLWFLEKVMDIILKGPIGLREGIMVA
jgi:hypothetical protein